MGPCCPRHNSKLARGSLTCLLHFPVQSLHRVKGLLVCKLLNVRGPATSTHPERVVSCPHIVSKWIQIQELQNWKDIAKCLPITSSLCGVGVAYFSTYYWVCFIHPSIIGRSTLREVQHVSWHPSPRLLSCVDIARIRCMYVTCMWLPCH